mmetsp:Transcript_62117/g.115232  ORF Transcript_62117/g.115232 Transcript_62117/m.115232 type:complete len:222 (-) Transcript_62117:299-964(-)
MRKKEGLIASTSSRVRPITSLANIHLLWRTSVRVIKTFGTRNKVEPKSDSGTPTCVVQNSLARLMFPTLCCKICGYFPSSSAIISGVIEASVSRKRILSFKGDAEKPLSTTGESASTSATPEVGKPTLSLIRYATTSRQSARSGTRPPLFAQNLSTFSNCTSVNPTSSRRNTTRSPSSWLDLCGAAAFRTASSRACRRLSRALSLLVDGVGLAISIDAMSS